MSHKIIEKRRRDRMNSCLADLSHLIPSNYLKKGRGRIEKTEIVEMAIKHIKYLHSIVPTSASITGNETTEISADVTDTKLSWRYVDKTHSLQKFFPRPLLYEVKLPYFVAMRQGRARILSLLIFKKKISSTISDGLFQTLFI